MDYWNIGCQNVRVLNRAYIVFERFEAKKDDFTRFSTLKYRFMATFGKETEEIFTKAHQTINRIFGAAYILGNHYWQRQGRVKMDEEEFKKHLDEMHREQEVFWDHGKDVDEIKTGLDEVLSELERVTEPAFQDTSAFYGLPTTRLFKKMPTRTWSLRSKRPKSKA